MRVLQTVSVYLAFSETQRCEGILGINHPWCCHPCCPQLLHFVGAKSLLLKSPPRAQKAFLQLLPSRSCSLAHLDPLSRLRIAADFCSTYPRRFLLQGLDTLRSL